MTATSRLLAGSPSSLSEIIGLGQDLLAGRELVYQALQAIQKTKDSLEKLR